jgi:hypothetical protein
MGNSRAALLALSIAALALASCQGRADQAPAAVDIDSANPLEQAAQDANLVDDPNDVAPTGLFERAHAVGTDGLCIAPDTDGYRFGMVANFGATLICEGRGRASHDGAQIMLDFDDADCTIPAVYDGRSVHLAGNVPRGCAVLCGERASFAGVAVSRVGSTEADAHLLFSRDAAIKKRPATPLCGP